MSIYANRSYFSSTVSAFFLNPVPAGISLPIITFSFRPLRESTPPLIAFSMRTRFVFWNDAAESQLLVRRDTSVIPSTTISAFACLFSASFPCNSSILAFSSINAVFSTISPIEKFVSPASFIFLRDIFFCQAEDGIRDWSVTGVQTCALPISSRRRHTRLVSDWSSDVCSSDRSEEHTSELQSLTNLVCRIIRSEEHTSELQSLTNLVCRLLLEKKKKKKKKHFNLQEILYFLDKQTKDEYCRLHFFRWSLCCKVC